MLPCERAVRFFLSREQTLLRPLRLIAQPLKRPRWLFAVPAAVATRLELSFPGKSDSPKVHPPYSPALSLPMSNRWMCAVGRALTRCRSIAALGSAATQGTDSQLADSFQSAAWAVSS